jgi:hypothetical protein
MLRRHPDLASELDEFFRELNLQALNCPLLDYS